MMRKLLSYWAVMANVPALMALVPSAPMTDDQAGDDGSTSEAPRCYAGGVDIPHPSVGDLDRRFPLSPRASCLLWPSEAPTATWAPSSHLHARQFGGTRAGRGDVVTALLRAVSVSQDSRWTVSTVG